MQEEAANAGQVNSHSPTIVCWIGVSLFNITYFPLHRKSLQMLWTGEKVLTSLSIKFVGKKKKSIIAVSMQCYTDSRDYQWRKLKNSLAIFTLLWPMAHDGKHLLLNQPNLPRESPERKIWVSGRSCWRWQHGLRLKAKGMEPPHWQAASPTALWLTQNLPQNLGEVRLQPFFRFGPFALYCRHTKKPPNHSRQQVVPAHFDFPSTKQRKHLKNMTRKALLLPVKICCHQDSIFWMKNVYC